MKRKGTFHRCVVLWLKRRSKDVLIERAVHAAFCICIMAAVFAVKSADAVPSRATASEIASLWSPKLKSCTDYGQFGGSPERAKTIAGYSFRIVGTTLEELWNHYADLCGVKDRYTAEVFLNTTGTNSNGYYVVSEHPASDGKGRGISIFVLKTDAYIATVTFHRDPDGKSIIGGLTAATP